MNEYQIKFKSSAAKEFRKLSSVMKVRIQKAVNQLTENPRPSGVVKLNFRLRKMTKAFIYGSCSDFLTTRYWLQFLALL